jgi:hypothetical protein
MLTTGLEHRGDDRRLRHVLARARLVVKDALRLVEVPLAGLIEELERVLEVVDVLLERAELPAEVGVGPHEDDARLGALDLESSGAARGRQRREPQGVVAPTGHDVHLGLGEVVPGGDLRGRDLDVLAVLSAPVSRLKAKAPFAPEVRAARADRLDAVDVELPERRGDAARRVDAVACAGQSSSPVIAFRP